MDSKKAPNFSIPYGMAVDSPAKPPMADIELLTVRKTYQAHKIVETTKPDSAAKY